MTKPAVIWWYMRLYDYKLFRVSLGKWMKEWFGSWAWPHGGYWNVKHNGGLDGAWFGFIGSLYAACHVNEAKSAFREFMSTWLFLVRATNKPTLKSIRQSYGLLTFHAQREILTSSYALFVLQVMSQIIFKESSFGKPSYESSEESVP